MGKMIPRICESKGTVAVQTEEIGQSGENGEEIKEAEGKNGENETGMNRNPHDGVSPFEKSVEPPTCVLKEEEQKEFDIDPPFLASIKLVSPLKHVSPSFQVPITNYPFMLRTPELAQNYPIFAEVFLPKRRKTRLSSS